MSAYIETHTSHSFKVHINASTTYKHKYVFRWYSEEVPPESWVLLWETIGEPCSSTSSRNNNGTNNNRESGPSSISITNNIWLT